MGPKLQGPIFISGGGGGNRNTIPPLSALVAERLLRPLRIPKRPARCGVCDGEPFSNRHQSSAAFPTILQAFWHQTGTRVATFWALRSPPLLTTAAHWVGESRARVELGDKVVHIGGDNEFSAMQLLLASLAACDVEVITTHASLLGIIIEDLTIEARGRFNIQRLLGITPAPSPGYDQISYTVKLRAPGATDQQIALLKEMCERASPVGDSLARPIPITLEFVTG